MATNKTTVNSISSIIYYRLRKLRVGAAIFSCRDPAGTPRRRDVKTTSRNGRAVAVPIRHEYDVVTTSHLGLKTTSTQWQEYDVVATSYLGRQNSTQI